MNRYRRTSSVGAMLQELNWESLASRPRAARLVLFYKIHYGLVAMNMPLESKQHHGPTRKENSLTYIQIGPSWLEVCLRVLGWDH